jgi:hypothetical protein
VVKLLCVPQLTYISLIDCFCCAAGTLWPLMAMRMWWLGSTTVPHTFILTDGLFTCMLLRCCVCRHVVTIDVYRGCARASLTNCLLTCMFLCSFAGRL